MTRERAWSREPALSFHIIKPACNHLKQQIVLALVFPIKWEQIFIIKSCNMKWNAIISKLQYEKSVNRAIEIYHAMPGTEEKDELTLLLIMIKDYEQRHRELPAPGSQKMQSILNYCSNNPSGNHQLDLI